jgi:hypothetical protein
MGFSKKMIYRFSELSRDNPRRMKKLIIYAGVVLLSCTVLAAFLIFSAISGLKGFVASSTDLDLFALQELVKNKGLILTETQKTQMIPLAQRMSQETTALADRAALKKQLYGLLDPAQIQKIDEWKTEVTKKAGEFTSSPQNIVSAIERYTGISAEPLKRWIDAIFSWWKINKPENNVQGLNEALQKKE